MTRAPNTRLELTPPPVCLSVCRFVSSRLSVSLLCGPGRRLRSLLLAPHADDAVRWPRAERHVRRLVLAVRALRVGPARVERRARCFLVRPGNLPPRLVSGASVGLPLLPTTTNRAILEACPTYETLLMEPRHEFQTEHVLLWRHRASSVSWTVELHHLARHMPSNRVTGRGPPAGGSRVTRRVFAPLQVAGGVALAIRLRARLLLSRG